MADLTDLFATKEFRAMEPWFLELAMPSLRTKAYQADAINHDEQQTLQAMEGKGPQTHNAALLAMVRAPGTKEAFKRLAEAVKLLGDNYKPKYNQMMAIYDLGKAVRPPIYLYAPASPPGRMNRSIYPKGPVADPNAQVKVAVIKTVILGNTGAGKSALLRELQYQPRTEHGDSTGVADIGTFYGPHDGGTAWQESARVLNWTVANLIRNPPPVRPAHSLHQPTSAAAATSGSSPVSALAEASASPSSDSEGLADSPLKSQRIKAIVSRIKSQEYFRYLQKGVSGGWLCFFRVYDTGGQDNFRCARHVMFSGDRTSYIIAYNAGMSIRAPSRQSMNRQGGEDYPCAEVSPGQPQLAYIHHILDAIRNVPHYKKSRIYIVGCRIDEREEGTAGLEKDKDDILESLKCKRFREMVTKDCIFFIQNRSKSDQEKGRTPSPDLIKLRGHLGEDGKLQPQFPFARLYEMLAFQELTASRRDELWISRAEAKQLGESLGNVNDEKSLDEMLTFHTGIGSVLYYRSKELKDRVVVGIEAMVEAMSAIIQPGLPERFEPENPSTADKALYRRGFITESMAIILWRQYCPRLKFLQDTEDTEDRKFFLKLMEQLNLLCDIGVVSMESGEEKRVYLLPALADDTKEVCPDLPTVSEPFYLATTDGAHLPHSTFTQLGVKSIARHHGDARRSAAWRGCKFSTSSMRIPWKQDPQIWLHLHHLQGGIGLRLEAGREDVLESLGPKALEAVTKMLEDVKGTANAELELEESMRCPCEPKEEVSCMYHRMESCGQDDSCFHCVTLPEDKGNGIMCQGHNVTVNADGLAFWKELRQEERTYRLLHLDSAEKDAESRNSEEREANPWRHERFVGSTASLVRKLTSTLEVRSLCFSNGLIDNAAQGELSHIQQESAHNEKLIFILMQGSPDSFAKFREVIRYMNSTGVFTKMLREWDSIGPLPGLPEFRKLQEKLLSEN